MITSMYLSKDAKLWWRTKTSDDVTVRRPKINTWETLKKELKDQFLTTNTAWMAHESLKKLKQTSFIRDYVKEFSSSILDIKDMSKVDKLFNFMSRLQAWIQTELRRQGMKDLLAAMATKGYLVYHKLNSSSTTTQKRKNQQQQSSKKGGVHVLQEVKWEIKQKV